MAQFDQRSDLIGQRLYNHEIDECATIIDIDPLPGNAPDFAMLQYDDGTFWDESVGTVPEGKKFGLDPSGLFAAHYELVGPGPTVGRACEDHDWYPTPKDLFDTYDQLRSHSDHYERIARCTKCGLSAATVINYLGHLGPPTICVECDEEIPPNRYQMEGEYADTPVCADCLGEAEA